MNSNKSRALIVDDESDVRRLTARALTAVGFECDEAVDGAQALPYLEADAYDLLVTDLRMPGQHGYALARAVLEMKPRPFILVLTGVANARITEDLLLRGVDDIVFKPVSYDLLATKAKAMMTRQRVVDAAHSSQPDAPPVTAELQRISLVELGRKIAQVSEIFPISQAALDVFNMTSAGNYDATRIADLIDCDAALTTQILKLANSSFYNRSGHAVTSTKDAVIRVGQRQIGEIALAHNALSAISSTKLPWMDARISWLRSLAAGVAMQRLVESGSYSHLELGLRNAAIMHPLGRVVLGTLFPDHYRRLIDTCEQSGECLRVAEREIFPVPHGHVLTNVLSSWGIPASATRPLTHLHDSFEAIAKLPERERIRACLLKMAVYLGRSAVGQWEGWDTIEFPPTSIMREFGVEEPQELLDVIGEDVLKLAETGHASAECGPIRDEAAKNGTGTLPTMLTDLGRNKPIVAEVIRTSQDALILNCVGAGTRLVAQWLNFSPLRQCLVVTDSRSAENVPEHEHMLVLPASFRRLERRLRALAAVSPNPPGAYYVAAPPAVGQQR